MKKETQPNDELIKLGKKQEVYVPQGPFETPSKEFVNGPFYADIAEVMPELAPNPPSTQDSYESSENKAFPPIQLDEDSDIVIWGIVTYIIHQAR